MKSQQKIFNTFVFAEGFLVLVVQIYVSVLLTPYWGQTFYYWLYSLFFSMLGLGLGYYATPFLLKKGGGPILVLKKITTSLLVYSVIILAFSLVILSSFLDFFDTPLSGALFSLFVFFFIPALLLGTIPLTLVQHFKEEGLGSEGTLSGKVFGLSAFGGVFGVSVVSYIILPHYGTDAVALLILLMVLGIFLLAAKLAHTGKIKWAMVFMTFVGVLILFSQKKTATERLASTLEVSYNDEGILGKLTVLENSQNQVRYVLVNNNIQSEAHFSGRSMNPYVYATSMYASYFPKKSKVLVAGLGCGSLAYEFGQMGYNVDVVDIDKRLHDLVQDDFLVSKNNYHFKHSDARRFLKISKKKYDVVLLDLSHGENVPTNVYTLEGFKEVKEDLRPDGLLLVHFLAAQTEDGKMALASVIYTMEKAGFDVEIMNFLNRDALFDAKKWGGNPEGFVLAAKTKKVDLHLKELKIDPSLLKEMHPNREKLYLQFQNPPKPQLLTDDLPILDLFHAETALMYRALSIQQLKHYYTND